MPDRHTYGSYSLGDGWPETPPPSRGLPAGLASAADQLRRLESEQRKRATQHAAQEQVEAAASEAERQAIAKPFQELIDELVPLLAHGRGDERVPVAVPRQNRRWWHASDTTTELLPYWDQERVSESGLKSHLRVYQNGDWHFHAGLERQGVTRQQGEFTLVCRFAVGRREADQEAGFYSSVPVAPSSVVTPEIAFSEFRLTLATFVRRVFGRIV